MMKSVQEAKLAYEEASKEVNARDEEADIFRLMNKKKVILRARRSELFAYKVLPEFLPLVKECVEKGHESYYITLNNGKRYIYYPTSSKLHTIVNGRSARKITLYPNQFFKYFSFLKE